MMKLLLNLIFLITLFSQAKDSMTKYDLNHYGIPISKITVKWSFSTLLGEPIINGTFKWESSAQQASLSYKDFIVLKCEATNGSGAYAYVSISPATPRNGGGYGYNMSGSPSWNDVFCGFDANGVKQNCFGKEDAKSFWKNGFKVTDFYLTRKN